MNLRALDQMLNEVGWRRLVSFDMTRVVVTPIVSRHITADAQTVANLLTLADIRWEKSHGYLASLVVYIPLYNEPPNP